MTPALLVVIATSCSQYGSVLFPCVSGTRYEGLFPDLVAIIDEDLRTACPIPTRRVSAAAMSRGLCHLIAAVAASISMCVGCRMKRGTLLLQLD
jgi:hypothetical protein